MRSPFCIRRVIIGIRDVFFVRTLVSSVFVLSVFLSVVGVIPFLISRGCDRRSPVVLRPPDALAHPSKAYATSSVPLG